MKNRFSRLSLFLAVSALLIPSVEARSLKKDLAVSLREKQVQNMSPEGLTLSFILEVANASAEPCLLTGYDYRVIVENAEFFRLNRALEDPLEIAPSGRTLIALPVKFTYEYVRQLLPGLDDREKVGCTLVGGLVFAEKGRRGERLNVAMTGDFPVFKGFRAAVPALEVRALSVGGADLTFRAEFQNLSAFVLEVESIRYRLDLGSTRVAEGNAGGGRLEPGGRAALSLPLLLEFFELGTDLHPLLRRSEADYKLTGELRILTAWGSHAVPFDLAGHVSVLRVE